MFPKLKEKQYLSIAAVQAVQPLFFLVYTH